MDMGMDSNNYFLLIYISFEESTKNKAIKSDQSSEKYIYSLFIFGNGVRVFCFRQTSKWFRIFLTSKIASIGDFPRKISAVQAMAEGLRLKPSVWL